MRKVILALALVSTVGAAATAVAADTVKTRQDSFKQFKADMGDIKAALGTDLKLVQARGDGLAAAAKTIPSWFPAGSTSKDAKAEIWSAPADFAAKAEAMRVAAAGLSTAAATGDAAKTVAAFQTLGGACKSCHQSFKAD